MEWSPIPANVLNIPLTLTCGQTFRWEQTHDGGFVGAIGDTAVLLQPENDGFHWQTWPESNRWNLLAHYFALDVDLQELYSKWTINEPQIAEAIDRFRGLRIVRQPADEALFSFICASCNTVTKIARSVASLIRRAGEPIVDLAGQRASIFPVPGQILELGIDDLRSDLWGFRAERLLDVARYALMQEPGWPANLRSLPLVEIRSKLSELPGIGFKIADCVALFGLWHSDACPVDTHVRQVAGRLFDPEFAVRSLTPTVYNAIVQAFQDRFGEYAGWAQQYLYLENRLKNRQHTR